jgi:hypothetical protein
MDPTRWLGLPECNAMLLLLVVVLLSFNCCFCHTVPFLWPFV